MTDNVFTRYIVSEIPITFNEEARSVLVTAVTEYPVQVWDREQMSLINEVLLLEGVKLPASGKVPLLDSHQRGSVASVLGSARDFRINGQALECQVFFSSTNLGRETALKVKEGHLSDFSVGYVPLKSIWLKPGEEKEINGRLITGPVKVTTEWKLHELSITPIGADPNAKARSLAVEKPPEKKQEPKKEEKKTDTEKKAPPEKKEVDIVFVLFMIFIVFMIYCLIFGLD